MEVERRLEALGLALPPRVKVPPGVDLPFAFVRVRGSRAYVAGHGPQNPDGSMCDTVVFYKELSADSRR